MEPKKCNRFSALILMGCAWVGFCLSAVAETGVTNVINGVVTNAASALIVGDGGSYNALIMTNGAIVTSPGFRIGNGATASNNYVLVSGATTVWTNGGGYIGNESSGNALVINDGAKVTGGAEMSRWGGSNNSVLVTGAGSVWYGGVSAFGRPDGGNNRLTVADGGQVFGGGVEIWLTPNSLSTFLVTGPGSVWSNSGGFYIQEGQFNITVSDGGKLFAPQFESWLAVGGTNTGVLVTGANSLLSILDLRICQPNASLIVTNGGKVLSGYAYVGSWGEGSLVTVAGSGSVWSNTGWTPSGSSPSATKWS
jgi:T5SS/PEP-CTERM-associated repeat protein